MYIVQLLILIKQVKALKVPTNILYFIIKCNLILALVQNKFEQFRNYLGRTHFETCNGVIKRSIVRSDKVLRLFHILLLI